MKRLICILLFPFIASAATINVSTFLELSNAVCSTAAEGDLVLIGAVDFTISNSITINRGRSFTIAGSGTNQTTLRSRDGLFNAFYVTSNSTATLTFSNFNAIGAYNDSGFISVGNNIPGTPLKGLVRISNVRMTNVMNVGLAIGYADSFALVDHCVFFTVDGGVSSFNAIQFYGNQFWSWTNVTDNPLGTRRACVVEDCYFQNNATPGNGGNGFYDGYSGMQGVVRYCVFDGNVPNGCHGYDSGISSMRTLEVYNNVFTNITSLLSLSRGGVYHFFSNTIWKADNNSIGPKLTYYRAANGSYQGTYGYPGYDKTNTYSTNWLDGGREDIGATIYRFTDDLASFVNSGGYVKRGATLAESLTNLISAVNNDPAGAGTRYTAITTNDDGNIFGRLNYDFRVISNTTNKIVLRNIMDGPNSSGAMPTGYPAAMQNGVLAFIARTNTGVVQVPCAQWSNVVHYANGTTALAVWEKDFEGVGLYVPNYVDEVLVEGRDYTNNAVAANYSPLTYPHPEIGASQGEGGSSNNPGVRGAHGINKFNLRAK